MNTEEVRNTE